MSKLHEFKSWYSISEAAARISSSVDEKVVTADLLQLVLEEHLRLSWYPRQVCARPVARFTFIWGQGFFPLSDLEEISKQAKNNYCSQSFEERSLPWKDFFPEKYDEVSFETWVSTSGFDEPDTIVHLDGPYYLELESSAPLKAWIRSIIFKTDEEHSLSDGFCVSDSDGNSWQVLRHVGEFFLSECPDDENMVPPIPSYSPMPFLPTEEELIFQRKDIELIEQSLLEKREADKKVKKGVEVKRVRRDEVTSNIHKYLDSRVKEDKSANIDDCWRFLADNLDPHKDGYIIWYTKEGKAKHLTKKQVSDRFRTALNKHSIK